MTIASQSPEADLDRDIEELIGKKMRGTFTQMDEVRLVELQSLRSRLMTSLGRGIYHLSLRHARL